MDWVDLSLGPDGLPPGEEAVAFVDVPGGRRGVAEVVVVARRHGREWITHRIPVGFVLWVPGDAARLAGAIGLGTFTIALSRRRRVVRHPLRRVGRHTVAAAFVGLALVTWIDRLHYRPFPHSDGAHYAVLARALAEGAGLRSPIIQPGLIDFAQTDATGQAFTTQSPAWPLLLSTAFLALGPSARTQTVLGELLIFVSLVVAFWTTALLTRAAWPGYVAVLVAALSPRLVPSAIGGGTEPLQAALLTILAWLAVLPPHCGRCTVFGATAGAAMFCRETSLFAVAPLALWVALRSDSREASSRRRLTAIAFALGIVWLTGSATRNWLGGAPGATLHATLLYGTPVGEPRWYWSDDDSWRAVSPLRYFVENPRILVEKARRQAVAGGAALLGMLSFSPLLLPVVWPRATREPARSAVLTLMAAPLLLTAGGAIAFLHPTYYTAFIPFLAIAVASTVAALAARSSRSSAAGVLAAATVIYAAGALLSNAIEFSQAGAVEVGEYRFAPGAPEQVARFLEKETHTGALIAVAHHPAPLFAWHTRRVFLQYDPSPDLRISPSPRWQRILSRRPVDFVLFSTLMERGNEAVPSGFVLHSTLSTGLVRAWLYRSTGAPSTPSRDQS